MSNYNCLIMMILKGYHANYRELTSLINMNTLRKEVRVIKEHDQWQINGRKREAKS